MHGLLVKNMFKTPLLAITMSAVLTACSGGDKIASVDGRAIDKEEFLAYLEFKRIPTNDEKRVQRALQDYLEREALAEAILDADVIDEAKAEAEANEFRKQMLISRYFETHLKNKVTDAAIENYYSSNTQRYQNEQVKVAHILLRVPSQMPETERQAVLTEAHEIHSLLKTGADFSELAKTRSQDALSANKGGDLGWIKKGAIDPLFSKVAFELKRGEVSEPIQTPFGFHILKQVEPLRVHSQPLELVKGDIRYQLRQQVKDAELARLMADSDIEIEKDFGKKLETKK